MSELQQLICESLSVARTSEIASHVDTCVECRATIESLTDQPTFDSGVEQQPDFLAALKRQLPRDLVSDDEWRSHLAPAETAGELGRLEHFRVLEVIGRGGMGIVLKAHDTKLNRDVAIKIMRPGIALEKRNRDRFLREARAIAAIDHRHVVPVYQVGQYDSMPYMVMKCLKGETLAERLRRDGKPGEQDLRRIAAQTLSGLAAAHETGFLHRDLKPENIWIESDSDSVRLLDFGFTRPEDQTRITLDGAFWGHPPTWRPSKLGASRSTTARIFFGLGAVLFEASTGEMPFPGKTVIEVLSALANREPVSPRRLNPELSVEFECLVMSLLQKDPAERPKTTEEIASLLGVPAGAGRRRRVAAQSVFGLAATIVLLGFVLFQMRTSSGTVVVELADGVDPSAVAVELKRDGVVQVIDARKDWKIRVDEGQYHVSLKSGSDRFVVQKERVVVNRDGSELLRVFTQRTRSKATDSGGSESRGDSAMSHSSTGQRQQSPTHSTGEERDVVRWVLSVGGHASIQGGAVKITNESQIPAEPFRVHTIDLVDTQVVDTDLRRLGGIRNLWRLYIGVRRSESSRLTERAFRELRDLKRLAIGELHVRGMNLGTTGFEEICKLSELRGVYLYGVQGIRDDDLVCLNALSRLISLSLWDCKLTGRGLRDVTCPNLQFLSLYSEVIDGAVVAGFPSWPKLSRIQLNIPGPASFGDEALLALAKHRELTELNLAQLRHVTEKGIGVVGRFPKLTKLTLRSVRAVDDDVVAMIARVASNLEELEIRGCPVTEIGVASLESMSQLKRIEFASSVEVSEAALERLQQAVDSRASD